MPPAPASTSAQAFSNLQTAESQQQSPDQIVSGTNQSLGVPQAQQQVSGLRQAIANTTNLLNNVAPSVYGRTQNSLVTDAQATKQIGNEQAPISANLNKENTDLGNSASDLSNLLSQAGNLENLKVNAQNNNISNLENIYKDLTAKEQQDAANKLAAEQFAEQQRQFNASLSDSQSARSSAAAAKQPSSAELKQTDMGNAAQYLQSLAGRDGHVSQSTWNNAMAKWTAAGYSAKDFVNNNMQYINQRYGGYHGYS